MSSEGPGRGYASEAPYRVSSPDDPKAKEMAEKAGVSPEVVAEKQNTGTSADSIPYDKKVSGGQKGGSQTGSSGSGSS